MRSVAVLVLAALPLMQARCEAAASATSHAPTYVVPTSAPVLIRGATLLTGAGQRLDASDVLMADGRIVAVGPGLAAPADAHVFDARGLWVTPGLIDVHSHLGVEARPAVAATLDFNEMSAPVTAEVWAEHSVWAQDPAFEAALAAGVTTLQILPGSGNLIGGRGVTLKNVAAATYHSMKFPAAPQSLKLACGENPKRNYGQKGQAPMTRMGNVAGYRQAFADAQDYGAQWVKYERERRAFETKSRRADAQAPIPPRRNLRLETLLGALQGELLVHVHCYRADDMLTMLELAQEFGFRIAAFHHAVEAYKIAGHLAAAKVCGALWADWWGFKMEAYDGIQENLVFVDRAPGGCAIVHSDSEEGIQRLNQEAAKSMMRGARVGLPVAPERAIQWLTANAARVLGIAERTGTLEPGKMGDVVIWNGNPFSVYALTQQVFIDGALVFDRRQPATPPRSDFMLGQQARRAIH